MLPVGHKRKRVQTKLFGDDFVRDDLRPGKGARRRKVMEPGGPDEAQGADALLSLAALAEEAGSGDTQSADDGILPPLHVAYMASISHMHPPQFIDLISSGFGSPCGFANNRVSNIGSILHCICICCASSMSATASDHV